MERRNAPLASSRSITSDRCDNDRARRSIRTTTSLSPLATRSRTRASTGRARLPPEAYCSNISTQPAAFRASDWGRGGLILGRYARTTYHGLQNSLFPDLYIATKRSFDHRCIQLTQLDSIREMYRNVGAS